jgi:hypothetical protein
MTGNPVEIHTGVLAARLREAYEVVEEHKTGRQQKIQYDKKTN